MEYPLWKPASAALPRDDDAIQRSVDRVMGLVSRAADTNTSSPIVAQRLSPEVIPVFVRDFPLYNVIEKVPSNGLSHTFLQQTAFSQSTAPHTIAETGTVSDDTNSYLRKTTNIAVAAIRRGVTLKAQYAGQAAGGASQDLMGRELAGGLLTIARDMQNEILRYQESNPSAVTATAADGLYDPNGLNGLRYTVNELSPPENTIQADIRTAGWTDQRVLKSVRNVVNAIWDKGGKVDLLVCTTKGSEAMFEDQFQQIRYVKDGTYDIAPGLSVRAISTDQGEIPVLVVPGQAIGTYTLSGSDSYTDIFALWTDTLQLPYLGAPEPTVLRIPIGTDGTLRELAIPFIMLGFACLAPQYLGRVQLRTA